MFDVEKFSWIKNSTKYIEGTYKNYTNIPMIDINN